MKHWKQHLLGVVLGILGGSAVLAGAVYQGGVGRIGILPGKVNANNALVISVAAPGTQGSSTGQIATLPGKVNANNALVVALDSGSGGGIPIPAGQCIAWGNTADTWLQRDAAGALGISGASCGGASSGQIDIGTVLFSGGQSLVGTTANVTEVRNGASAQRLSVFSRYGSATDNERFSIDWQTTANVAIVGGRTATTGTGRTVAFVSETDNAGLDFAGMTADRKFGAVYLGLFSSFTAGAAPTKSGTSTVAWVHAGWATSMATSGTVVPFAIEPTYNQTSGSAGNTDFLVNRTETAIGSGTQRLMDLQVGGVTKFNVDRNGSIVSAGQMALASGNVIISAPSNGVATLTTSAANVGVRLSLTTDDVLQVLNRATGADTATVKANVANFTGKYQINGADGVSCTSAGTVTSVFGIVTACSAPTPTMFPGLVVLTADEYADFQAMRAQWKQGW